MAGEIWPCFPPAPIAQYRAGFRQGGSNDGLWDWWRMSSSAGAGAGCLHAPACTCVAQRRKGEDVMSFISTPHVMAGAGARVPFGLPLRAMAGRMRLVDINKLDLKGNYWVLCSGPTAGCAGSEGPVAILRKPGTRCCGPMTRAAGGVRTRDTKCQMWNRTPALSLLPIRRGRAAWFSGPRRLAS